MLCLRGRVCFEAVGEAINAPLGGQCHQYLSISSWPTWHIISRESDAKDPVLLERLHSDMRHFLESLLWLYYLYSTYFGAGSQIIHHLWLDKAPKWCRQKIRIYFFSSKMKMRHWEMWHQPNLIKPLGNKSENIKYQFQTRTSNKIIIRLVQWMVILSLGLGASFRK